MGKSYKKPILVEIFCEIFLQKNSLDQSKIVELIPNYKAVGFEALEISQVPAFLLDVGQPPSPETIFRTPVPRFKIWDRTKTKLIHLPPDFLALIWLVP